MKRFLLIFLLPVAVMLLAVSCTKDPATEESFLDISDGSEAKEPNQYWDWADVYPGMVSPNAARCFDQDVPVRGGYAPMAYSPSTPILQSTGLFAAMDEVVAIEVPEGTTELHWQIGLGHALHKDQLKRRAQDVVSNGKLKEGSNSISSPFGGYLFFYYEPNDMPVSSDSVYLKVTGAVISEDFIDGMDPMEASAWGDMMRERSDTILAHTGGDIDFPYLLWLEMRSEKINVIVGMPEMTTMLYPQYVMNDFKEIADAFWYLGGIDPTNQPPFRVHTDVQMPDPLQRVGDDKTWHENIKDFVGYAGYPISILRTQGLTGKDKEERNVINRDYLRVLRSATGNKVTPDAGYYTLLRAFSNTVMAEWATSPYIQSAAEEIGYMFFAHKLGHHPATEYAFGDGYERDFTKGPSGDALARLNFYYNTDREHQAYYGNLIVQMADQNLPFVYDNYNDANSTDNMKAYVKRKFLSRLAFMMTLIKTTDWGIVRYLNVRCRELGFKNEWDQDANDFLVMAACEYAGKNLLTFFDVWHFPYTYIAYDYAQQFPDKLETPAVGELWRITSGLNPAIFDTHGPWDQYSDADKTHGYPAIKTTGVNWYPMSPNNGWHVRTRISYPYTDKPFIGGVGIYKEEYLHAGNPYNVSYPYDDCVNDAAVSRGGFTQLTGSLRFNAANTTDPEAANYQPDWQNWMWLKSVSEITLGNTPIEFNVMSWTSSKVGMDNNNETWSKGLPVRLTNIEYFDPYDGEDLDGDSQPDGMWKPTNPSSFRIVKYLYDVEKRAVKYYFHETYKASKFRFSVQPEIRSDAAAEKGLIEVDRIAFGLLKTKTAH